MTTTETAPSTLDAELLHALEQRAPFALLPAAALEIPRYQPQHRAEAEDAITGRIASSFEPAALAGLVVSYRDGHLYLVDGQRRRAAALLAGYAEPLPCILYYDLTEAQEMRIWEALDVRGYQHIVDRFRVYVQSGHPPVARAINTICGSHGFVIDFHNSETTIASVECLEMLYAWEVLDTVLYAVRNAWPSDGKPAVDRRILMALGSFAHVYAAQFVPSILVATLRPQSAQKLVQDAIARRLDYRYRTDAPYMGTTVWATLAVAIRRLYNERVSHDARLNPYRQPAIPYDRLVIGRSRRRPKPGAE